MLFLLAIVLSFVPAFACALFVYWLDRYEKEPKLLLTFVFGWGAIVAVIGAIVAQLTLGSVFTAISGSEKAADVAGSTLFAPLTEESLKGLAVLAVFFLLRREFDSLLDGVVYAVVVALGFAATENVLYLYGASEEEGLGGMMTLFVLRVVLGIWDHPFYTSFIGIGLAMARLSRSTAVALFAPIAGWALACFFHGLHNTFAVISESSPFFLLAMFLVDWSGWLFMAVLAIFAIRHEGGLLQRHLHEEVGYGILTPAQYEVAVSSFKRTGASLRALGQGRLAETRRFYHLCGELAHKKHHYVELGDEQGNLHSIQEIRAELAHLAPAIQA